MTHHVETIVLLSKLDSQKYISVELSMDDMDLTWVESKVTHINKFKIYFLRSLGLVLTCILHRLARATG